MKGRQPDGICHYCGISGLPDRDIACENCEQDLVIELIQHHTRWEAAKERVDMIKRACRMSKSEQHRLINEIECGLDNLKVKIKPSLVKACRVLIKSGYMNRHQFEEICRSDILTREDMDVILQ